MIGDDRRVMLRPEFVPVQSLLESITYNATPDGEE
jgi:hypothetical protein